MNAFTLPVEDAVLSGTVIAPQPPRAILVLVHGMAEHKERYYPFMTYLSEHGFACVITDLRGHGASAPSPEELGHFGKKGIPWEKKSFLKTTLTLGLSHDSI